jgi:hypothetical protein
VSNDEITNKIEALPRLPRAELLSLWRQLFAHSPHPRLRRELMIPILAYRLQERAYGGLKPSTCKRLQRLAEQLAQSPEDPLRPVPEIKAGTKLLRQWQGTMHEVSVAEEGFGYRGKRYRSLSEIARLITGTRWSGPTFFGLKPKQKETTR